MLSYILYVILIDKKIKTDSCADSGFKNDKIEFSSCCCCVCVCGGESPYTMYPPQAIFPLYIYIYNLIRSLMNHHAKNLIIQWSFEETWELIFISQNLFVCVCVLAQNIQYSKYVFNRDGMLTKLWFSIKNKCSYNFLFYQSKLLK